MHSLVSNYFLFFLCYIPFFIFFSPILLSFDGVFLTGLNGLSVCVSLLFLYFFFLVRAAETVAMVFDVCADF